MTLKKVANECVCNDVGAEQKYSYKISIPNFYGVELNIYTNSRRLNNAMKRFLFFFLNRPFQNYTNFYFPNVRRSYNISFSIQKEDAEDITYYLDLLEKYLRKMICEYFFIFHGSVVTKKNYQLFLIGDPKVGKSTLAINFSENGWRFYADDIVLLKKDDYRCFAFPELIKIRKASISYEQSLVLKRLNIKELLLKDVIDLSNEEFKIYLNYLKRIYSFQNEIVKAKPKKYFFIFLDKMIVKKPSIYKINKFTSIFNIFRNIYLDSCLGRKKDLVELIFMSKCYSLKKGHPEDTRRLILDYLQLK
ncbi:MAG: hypothetical protein ABH873_05505 [Candidatus Firestonebacteria bacterium]